MAMTDVMDEVDYKRRNFNQNEAVGRHPLWMTDTHYVYHLCYDDGGHLVCAKDSNGDAVCSPRYLLQMCVSKLVRDPNTIRKVKTPKIPTTLYPTMLMEAIFHRELQAVSYLVSSWPLEEFNIYNCLPLEEYIDPGYLTLPVDGAGSMSLVDSIIMGILNLRPESKLKVIDVTGFETDRKLCRELARLPILWMKSAERRAVRVHEMISQTLNISLDKVQRYINRIGCIYSSMDIYIKHGTDFGPITIVWDCKITLDDVPIGLALQEHSPFRFSCKKLWFQPMDEIDLPYRAFPTVLDPRMITHIEIADENLCSDLSKFDSFLECLLLLPSLTAISLPNTIHVDLHPNAAYELNLTLKSLPNLQKLNFSSSNLKDSLAFLLGDLDIQLIFLNLRDCRLSQLDLEFLLQWKSSSNLLELNLSRNNLKHLTGICMNLIDAMSNITCLSISYCSFSPTELRQIVQKCQNSETLKVLCIKSFTPPPLGDIREILEDCAAILRLQKCAILPEAYAFPGGDDYTRNVNRERLSSLCSHFLIHQQRSDIEVE